MNFILIYSGGTTASNVGSWIGNANTQGPGAPNEAKVEQMVAVGATYTTLRCFDTVSQTAGELTLRKNGANTSATCTFPAGGSTVCTPAAGSVTVVPGDVLDVEVTTNYATGGGVTSCGVN